MHTTTNPFEEITVRLSRIENTLCAIKDRNNSQSDSQGPEFPIDIKEAAKITGKSVPTLYGYCHRGTIPHMKRGQRLYFYKKELLDWIESGRVRTTDEIKQAAAESLEK